ncbi:MAG: flagellar hook-length control protein FliK [Desulfocapsaceae bacterium]|nr:flagellar hook-length control protein FliK [Desulfocapsaceae bacterium]
MTTPTQSQSSPSVSKDAKGSSPADTPNNAAGQDSNAPAAGIPTNTPVVSPDLSSPDIPLPTVGTSGTISDGKQAPVSPQSAAIPAQDDPAGKQTASFSLPGPLQNLTAQKSQTVQEGTTVSNQNTLVGQQLQDILTAHGATVLPSSPKPQTNNLDALSPPLFTAPAVQDPKASVTPDLSNLGGLNAPRTKGGMTDKTVDAPIGKLKESLPFLSAKTDQPSQKDVSGSQAKDPGLQNSDSNKDTTLLTSMSVSDSADMSQQTGQVSFDSTLMQTLQPFQHTATTSGTAGASSLVPWPPSLETSLVGQVMHNFSLSPNSPSSQLSIKLHPEELGELKIDIQMKDGAVKANIATQNEQVQQVMEKYIPKLKTFMEQQGLTVDSIHVTNTSDNVGGNNLFQQNFTNNQDYPSPGKSSQSATGADLSFATASSETTGTTSGVNVTV